MKALAKRVARLLLGEYAAYIVLQRCTGQVLAPLSGEAAGFQIGPVTRAEIEACADPVLREQAFYAGEGALAYACRVDGQIAGLCFYWYGERYRPRGFWPLQPDEAKLVQVITAPAMRGRRVAAALIARSAELVLAQGFRRLYARVWHSNDPSLRAFAAAGWSRRALVLEANPLRRARPWRLQLR